MAEHTPLPWIVDPIPAAARVVRGEYVGPGGVVAQATCPADAEFIARAVNAHQALVDACRAALGIEGAAEQAGAADAMDRPSKLAHARVDAITARILAALELAKVKP